MVCHCCRRCPVVMVGRWTVGSFCGLCCPPDDAKLTTECWHISLILYPPPSSSFHFVHNYDNKTIDKNDNVRFNGLNAFKRSIERVAVNLFLQCYQPRSFVHCHYGTVFLGLVSELLSVHSGAFLSISINVSIHPVYFISFYRLNGINRPKLN